MAVPRPGARNRLAICCSFRFTVLFLLIAAAEQPVCLTACVTFAAARLVVDPDCRRAIRETQ